jgi:hypothetical protein
MKTLCQYFLKSLLIGAAYAATLAITKLILSETVNARSFLWSFVGGSVTGFALGSLATSMPATWSRHMLVWGSAIFFNIASVTIEGHFFAPDLVRGSVIVMIIQQLIVTLAVTWVIVKLFAPIADTVQKTPIQPSWFSWLWRFIFSALSYVFFYYFFGAFAYLLVTGPYYETHTSGLVVPAQNVILKAELIRAPLMVFSVIPFLLNFPVNRQQLMWLAGLVLFMVGGATPLLMQAASLPLVVLAGSAAEIFCQNFSTGVVTSVLMSVDITKR